ncbi:ABC transporter ATP-binding protein [Salinirubellus sp. GCM10025818]|uniref:ABC transporter ATP-binding protein n=1 Tax=Salinirubellus TaxID=2162630 RepID=UPI0030D00B5D
MVSLFSAYGRPHLPLFVLGLLASLVGRTVGLVPPLVLGVTIDALLIGSAPYRLPLVPAEWLPNTPTGQFWLSAGLILASFVLAVAFTWTQTVSMALFSNRVQHAVRVETYRAMQRLDMAFFDDKQTGQVMSILNSDVRNLRSFLDSTVGGAIQLVVTVLGIAGVLFWLNAGLAVVTLVAVPLLAAFTLWFSRKIRARYRALREAVGALNTRLENNLSGIEVIKTAATEPYEADRVEDSSNTYLERSLDVVRLDAFYNPTMDLLAGLSFVATFVLGGYWLLVGTPPFLSGDLLVGEFVTFLFLTQRFVDPLAGVGRIVNSYENARASGERVFGLTGRTVSVADRPDARPLSVRGRVEFDDVAFAYREGTPVLDGVSFVAEPGETVALVGETGAGKSTAAKLLLRLYDVTEGAVRIDDVDVRDARLADLRDAIGYVSQDVFLFDGTVRENIAYGSFDATDEEIEAAARASEAHDFVLDLPDGYDTRVGERGVKLSGGQRQRLSIARAMLQDPEILVLDEATSAVDTATELAIQRGLARLTEGRTTLVVAHRLSTVRDADAILVLEDGRVIERGTHDELLDLGGRYASLWGVQTGGPDTVDLPSGP